MTSVDSNFNFLCGRPHGAGPSPPVHMRPPEPDSPPPPCGRHKWMAPYRPSVCPTPSLKTLVRLRPTYPLDERMLKFSTTWHCSSFFRILSFAFWMHHLCMNAKLFNSILFN